MALKLNKLPGTRGTFKAKTEKRTQMFSYQVTGTEEDKALYVQYKTTVEGYEPVIDVEYGLLLFHNRNVGREGVLDIYTNQNGELTMSVYNNSLREIDELKSAGVSQDKIDSMIIEALNKGKYATPVTVTVQEGTEYGNP